MGAEGTEGTGDEDITPGFGVSAEITDEALPATRFHPLPTFDQSVNTPPPPFFLGCGLTTFPDCEVTPPPPPPPVFFPDCEVTPPGGEFDLDLSPDPGLTGLILPLPVGGETLLTGELVFFSLIPSNTFLTSSGDFGFFNSSLSTSGKNPNDVHVFFAFAFAFVAVEVEGGC
jgi:hypothetical protein